MTGPAMALFMAFRGAPPKIEHGLWWAFYALWIVIVEVLQVPRPFITILLASTLAGLLHGSVQAIFLDRFLQTNPWHAEQMKGPRRSLAVKCVLASVAVGVGFGAVVSTIAWGIRLI